MIKSRDELNAKQRTMYYLKGLLLLTVSDAESALDALLFHEGDDKYSLSVNFLSMSHQSYLEMLKVSHSNELNNYAIQRFFRIYDEDFKVQLKQAIIDQDGDMNWLILQFEKLVESKNDVDGIIKNELHAIKEFKRIGFI